MKLMPTLRLRILLALYCGGIGFIVFETCSKALSMASLQQYFCYYEFLGIRTVIIISSFSATGFFILPSFFSPDFYNKKQALIGGAVSFILAMIFALVILSTPIVSSTFVLTENNSLLSLLHAEHGIYSPPSFGQAQAPNTVIQDLGPLSLFFLISFLISAIYGLLTAWPLYRYTYHNNKNQAYWRLDKT